MIQRSFRYYYLKVTRQRGTPESIAMGMAIGVFFGLFIPPVGQMIPAALTATFMKANRVTAILGTWISNPFTYAFIIGFYLLLGQFMTGVHVAELLHTPKHQREASVVKEAIPAPQAAASAPQGSIIPKSLDEAINMYRNLSLLTLLKISLVWFSASTVCSVVGAFASYHVTCSLVEGFRRKRSARQALRRRKLEQRAREEEAIRGIHMGLDD